jgi:hypothetical protein
MEPFELVDIEGERIIGPAALNGAIYLKNVPTLSLQSLVDGHTSSGHGIRIVRGLRWKPSG